MPRAYARIFIGLAVFSCAAALGFFLKPTVGSETIRRVAEERLTELLGAPVTIREVRLTLGFGIRLEGTDAVSWHDEAGSPALKVDRIRASIPITSLILRKPRFGRITLDGARLRIERGADDRWSPAPFAKLAARDDEDAAAAGAPPHRDELLSPLIRFENLARALLAEHSFADALELRNSTIVFIDARVERRVAPPLFLALDSVQAEFRRNRILGGTRAFVQARLVDSSGDRGRVELEGTRGRRGPVRVAMAVTDLQLGALAPYVRARHPEARAVGSLSGAVVFDAASPGQGRLEVDLVGHHVRTVEPRANASSVAVDRIEAIGTLEITPQSVMLHGARIRAGELHLEMDGTIARPLRSNSFAQISLAFREVEVSQVRHLIGWLPEVEREEAEEVVQVIERGRLHGLRAGGAATISAWQAFLAGRSRTPPADFFLDATLSDTVVTVGDDDRLEDLEGRLWWSGNHAQVQGVKATLNGSALPTLDVAVDGVTNFLAGDPERRRLSSGGVPLLGVRTLWEWFQPDPDDPDPLATRIALGLDVARMHHPMFLWPIEGASAVLWDTDSGLHIVTNGGTWAGVPVTGDADWIFEPEERVSVRLVASAPERAGPVAPPAFGWAEGTVVIGMRQDGPWRQQHAISNFTIQGGIFRFDDFAIPIQPRGELEASVELDLGIPNVVPFEVNFQLGNGDVSALAEQVGQPRDFVSGNVDLAGSFRGVLRPQTSILDGLAGLLNVDATDGTIRRSVPAVLAVALASQAYNPFARREEIRYEKCQTVLEFEDGRMATTGFSMDGPDVRVFAAGELDLLRPPHDVDAQVALFLFRQIDKIIGKIPIVNLLLLGTNENLVGAHFRLEGPWDDPRATSVPLRALASGPASIIEQGPASLVLQTIPMFMMKGIQAIESMLGLGDSREPALEEAVVPKPSES